MTDTTARTSTPFDREAQHSAKRNAILSQAAKLFNSRGSRTATLQDIAQGLGLTKTSLYYYVKTKEELIYQCYLATLEHHHATLDQIEKDCSAPLDRLAAFLVRQFDNWLDAVEGRGNHYAAPLEIASLREKHREAIEDIYTRLFKRLRGYLIAGMDDGSLRQCESISTTRAIIGSMDWVFHWLREIPRSEVHNAARDASDIITHGLAAGAGEYHAPPLKDSAATFEHTTGFDRNEQNRLKQEAFYKAGTWFFNKKGFNGASLDEIAEYLNVSKGAFYYHIRNKEDLLFACYNHSLDILADVYSAADQNEGTGIRKIDVTSRLTFKIQNSNQGPLIRYHTITALPTARRRQILARTDKNNDLFVKFIEQGIDDGSIRPVNAFVARNLLAGAINASMDIALWRKVEDADQAAIDYFDVFLNGLVPRNSASQAVTT